MPKQGGALGRAEISASIAEQIGISQNKAAMIVDGILVRMSEALEAGENVRIPNFGVFHLRDKPERPGRNPKTGEDHAISPRRVATFRASPALVATIQEGGTSLQAEN